jgi:hypothetical protein
MQNPGSDAGVFVWAKSLVPSIAIPGRALVAGRESILSIVVMDSGLDAPRLPGMTTVICDG